MKKSFKSKILVLLLNFAFVFNSAFAQIDLPGGRIVQISSSKALTSTTSELYLLALKDDGTVWSCGNNKYGQLGDGTLTNNRSIHKIPGLDSAAQVSAGTYHGVCLKSDGTVWAWGRNEYGQLGNGTTTDSLTPIQVKSSSGDGYLNNIVAVSANGNQSMALSSSGTVWTWGSNEYGQLGDGTTTDALLPVQVKNSTGDGYLENITYISMGAKHATAVINDGTVAAWGYNGVGQLGNGTTTDSLLPIKMKESDGTIDFSGVYKTVSTLNNTAVLTNSGNVWICGSSSYGLLGPENTSNSCYLVQIKDESGVSPLADIEFIDGGNNHYVVVKSDGTVLTWGNNRNGELGNNTLVSSNLPVVVDEIEDVVGITASTVFSMILKDNSEIYAWGKNDSGSFGDASFDYYKLPIELEFDSFIKICGGVNHTTALKSDGTVWSWGYNVNGELGDNSTIPSEVPVQVTDSTGEGYLTDIIDISSEYNHTLALKSDGTVWAWGSNAQGKLGNGTTTKSILPVQVKDSTGTGYLTNIVAIESGFNGSIALSSDGTVWYWGMGLVGQAGDGGDYERKALPVQVKDSTGSGLLTDVCQIGIGNTFSAALKTDGTVWVWGSNSNGQLGVGESVNIINLPVQVKDSTGTGNLTNIISIKTGSEFLLALKSDGTVWSWGLNSYGQLGNGTETTSFLPVQVKDVTGESFLSDIETIATGSISSFALTENNELYAWGYNGTGELGNNTIIDSNLPVRVLDEEGISYISGISEFQEGNFTFFVKKNDDRIFGWGRNSFGMIGDGKFIYQYLTPKKILDVTALHHRVVDLETGNNIIGNISSSGEMDWYHILPKYNDTYEITVSEGYSVEVYMNNKNVLQEIELLNSEFDMEYPDEYFVRVTKNDNDTGEYTLNVSGINGKATGQVNKIFVGTDVYYINAKDNGKMYKNNAAVPEVTQYPIEWMCGNGNIIYYGVNDYIYSLNNGVVAEETRGLKAKFTKTDGNNLYFSNWSDGGKLYKYNLSEDLLILICRDICSWIDIDENYIYYYNALDKGRLYKVLRTDEDLMTGTLIEE